MCINRRTSGLTLKSVKNCDTHHNQWRWWWNFASEGASCGKRSIPHLSIFLRSCGKRLSVMFCALMTNSIARSCLMVTELQDWYLRLHWWCRNRHGPEHEESCTTVSSRNCFTPCGFQKCLYSEGHFKALMLIWGRKKLMVKQLWSKWYGETW